MNGFVYRLGVGHGGTLGSNSKKKFRTYYLVYVRCQVLT